MTGYVEKKKRKNMKEWTRDNLNEKSLSTLSRYWITVIKSKKGQWRGEHVVKINTFYYSLGSEVFSKFIVIT